jgi:hypothetical protein
MDENGSVTILSVCILTGFSSLGNDCGYFRKEIAMRCIKCQRGDDTNNDTRKDCRIERIPLSV